jgi:serine/threonine protein kinase
MKAFTVGELAPKLIKFSAETVMDHQLMPETVMDQLMQKRGVVMPAFLSSVNSNNITYADAAILEKAILKCVRQVLTTLHVLHVNDIIHNDIKPGNTFCSTLMGIVICVTTDHAPVRDYAPYIRLSSVMPTSLLISTNRPW